MKSGILYELSDDCYIYSPGVDPYFLNRDARLTKFRTVPRDHANDDGWPAPPALAHEDAAFRALLLEPYLFAERYGRELTLVDSATNSRPRYTTSNQGLTLLSAGTHHRLLAMAESVRNHEIANSLVTSCDMAAADASIYWDDQLTRRLYRCRPNFWRADGLIVDVQAVDCGAESFRNSSSWEDTLERAAWCMDGMTEAYSAGHFPEDWAAPKLFMQIVVEKTAPFTVACYALDGDDIEPGRERYREKLRSAGKRPQACLPSPSRFGGATYQGANI